MDIIKNITTVIFVLVCLLSNSCNTITDNTSPEYILKKLNIELPEYEVTGSGDNLGTHEEYYYTIKFDKYEAENFNKSDYVYNGSVSYEAFVEPKSGTAKLHLEFEEGTIGIEKTAESILKKLDLDIKKYEIIDKDFNKYAPHNGSCWDEYYYEVKFAPFDADNYDREHGFEEDEYMCEVYVKPREGKAHLQASLKSCW